MADITIRSATSRDAEILWDFLAMAAYEPHAAAARAVPMVAAYLDGWRQPEDFGFIAEQAGIAIGAVWARQFAPIDHPSAWHADRTPELSIGVQSDARGQGVGRRLLHALIAEATRRELSLCLNVRLTNPAVRLYERLGFRAVPGMTVTNRVGGQSIWMVLDASS
jgi:ribosomal protein S18 acetylase RimI-like enzyme